MGDNTKISWADATWNPIRARNKDTGKTGWFCTKVTAACDNCYAETQNMRKGDSGGTGLPYKPGHLRDVDIFLAHKALEHPLMWKRPRVIFVCSMTDLFGSFVPQHYKDMVFGAMALAKHHTFLVLTKRPGLMREYLQYQHTPSRVTGAMFDVAKMRKKPITRETHPELFDERGYAFPPVQWPLPNVWIGTSICDQGNAEEFVPELMAAPAAHRFVSAGPLLGPLDLRNIKRDIAQSFLLGFTGIAAAPSIGLPPKTYDALDKRWPGGGIEWVVDEGESGAEARPTHPDWFRSLRDQCAAAGVHYHHKQNGEWAPGECSDKPMTRTEQTASYVANGRWDYSSITPAQGSELHCEDSPDVWRLGVRNAGRHLDGATHDWRPPVPA